MGKEFQIDFQAYFKSQPTKSRSTSSVKKTQEAPQKKQSAFSFLAGAFGGDKKATGAEGKALVKSKVDKMAALQEDLLNDLNAMEALHAKITDKLNDNKYNGRNPEGLLFYKKKDFEKSTEEFESYS